MHCPTFAALLAIGGTTQRVGVVSSPLKALLPDYRAIEARVEAAVLARFNVNTPLPPCVKHADLVALATEKRDLWPSLEGKGEWESLTSINPLRTRLATVPPSLSYEMFMKRFRQITEQ